METKTQFVLISVTKETRALLRELAEAHRTKIYQLVQTLAENDRKNFLPAEVNIDTAATEN